MINLDVGGLGTLMAASPEGWIAELALAVSMTITLGPVAIGAGIQRMGWEE